jgi:hypothetical protein
LAIFYGKPAYQQVGARSSVVEHHIDIVGARSSILLVRTGRS